MFSQLKDVLSPEKGKSGGPRGVDQTIKQHDQDVRNNELFSSCTNTMIWARWMKVHYG